MTTNETNCPSRGTPITVSRRRLLVMGLGGIAATAAVGLLGACGAATTPATAPATPAAGVGAPAPGAAPTAANTPMAAAPAATASPAVARYSYAPNTGKQRDALVVGVNGLPGGMDPPAELSNVGTRVTYNVYDTLIRRDFLDNNKLVPALAASWQRQGDTVMELSLRQGVTFHNGDPLTAEDVKYTFDRITKPGSKLSEAQGYFSTFKSVDVINPGTVRIETKLPDPLIEQRLASWASWIVPKAYIERVGDEEFAKNGIGTGPYKIVKLAPKDRLILERFDGYWEAKPPVKQLTFQVIPENATRATALINGEVSIITNIPPDQVKTLQGAPNVEIRDIPLANVHVIYYNTRHPALKNEKLRQALNLGIDRKLLIDTIWNGKAIQMRSHQFEEYGPLYNPNRPYTPYDPVRAKQLVAEAGYDGTPITYRTQGDYYTNGLQAAEAIVAMWQAIGVKAEVKQVGSGDKVVPAEVMVANWSNSSRLADPDGSLWVAWGKSSSTQKNYWTPADSEFNRLGEAARATLDQRTRYDAYQKMLDIWEKEAPGTVLYVPIENYGVSKDVNWSPYPFYYTDFRAYNLSFQ